MICTTEMLRHRVFRAATVVAVCAFGGVFATAQEDKIILRDNSEKTGQVEEYDFRSIKLKLAGSATTTIKVDEVQAVTFGGLPRDFSDAEAAAQRGAHAEAAAKYQAALDKNPRRPVKQDAMFGIGIAQINSGNAADGVKSLKALLAEGAFPQSRHIEAAESQIIAALPAAEQLPFVDGEIARVGKISDSGRLVDRLKLARCKILMAAGNLKDAKSDANALANSTGPGAGAAKVLLGDIARAEKNANDADRLYRDALRSTGLSRGDRAAVYNGLGALQLEKGVAGAGKPDEIRGALLSFLRVVVQFAPADGSESSAPLEVALLNAGICFERLAQLGTKAEQPLLRKRAKDLFGRLLNDFPQSQLKLEAETHFKKLDG